MEKERHCIKILSVIKLVLAILTLLGSVAVGVICTAFAVSYADDNEMREKIVAGIKEVIEENPSAVEDLNKVLAQSNAVSVNYNNSSANVDADGFARATVPVILAIAITLAVIKGIGAIYHIIYAAIGISVKKKPNKATALFVLAVLSIVSNVLGSLIFKMYIINVVPIVYNAVIAYYAYIVMRNNSNKLAQANGLEA